MSVNTRGKSSAAQNNIRSGNNIRQFGHTPPPSIRNQSCNEINQLHYSTESFSLPSYLPSAPFPVFDDMSKSMHARNYANTSLIQNSQQYSHTTRQHAGYYPDVSDQHVQQQLQWSAQQQQALGFGYQVHQTSGNSAVRQPSMPTANNSLFGVGSSFQLEGVPTNMMGALATGPANMMGALATGPASISQNLMVHNHAFMQQPQLYFSGQLAMNQQHMNIMSVGGDLSYNYADVGGGFLPSDTVQFSSGVHGVSATALKPRPKRILQMTDPKTGEDRSYIFKRNLMERQLGKDTTTTPDCALLDDERQHMNEKQNRRNAINFEFRSKVAALAVDLPEAGNESGLSHPRLVMPESVLSEPVQQDLVTTPQAVSAPLSPHRADERIGGDADIQRVAVDPPVATFPLQLALASPTQKDVMPFETPIISSAPCPQSMSEDSVVSMAFVDAEKSPATDQFTFTPEQPHPHPSFVATGADVVEHEGPHIVQPVILDADLKEGANSFAVIVSDSIPSTANQEQIAINGKSVSGTYDDVSGSRPSRQGDQSPSRQIEPVPVCVSGHLEEQPPHGVSSDLARRNSSEECCVDASGGELQTVMPGQPLDEKPTGSVTALSAVERPSGVEDITSLSQVNDRQSPVEEAGPNIVHDQKKSVKHGRHMAVQQTAVHEPLQQSGRSDSGNRRSQLSRRKELSKGFKEGSDMDAFSDVGAVVVPASMTDDDQGITPVSAEPSLLPEQPQVTADAVVAATSPSIASTDVEHAPVSLMDSVVCVGEGILYGGVPLCSTTTQVTLRSADSYHVSAASVSVTANDAARMEDVDGGVTAPVCESLPPLHISTHVAVTSSHDTSSTVGSESGCPPAHTGMPFTENGDVMDDDGMEHEDEPVAKVVVMSGVKMEYLPGQWSPFYPQGKRVYDRCFLIALRASPESQKRANLPDIPEIIMNVENMRHVEFGMLQMMASDNSMPDFTPGFFRSQPSRSGGLPAMHRRGSQQGRRLGPGSLAVEPQRIICLNRQEVQLHKSENAYKPLFAKQEDADTMECDEKDRMQLSRTFNSILNKLTPEKFDKLSQEAYNLKIDSDDRLHLVADLIFEKAIAEPKFAKLYAKLCEKLSTLPRDSSQKCSETFKNCVLTRCQREFETDKKVEGEVLDQQAALVDAPQEKRQQLEEEMERLMCSLRRRSIGNIQFMGELFQLKLLREKVVHQCIDKLLGVQDDDSIECLTKLLDTTGKDLDYSRKKMDGYFLRLEAMASRSADSKHGKLSVRVKFIIQEILDLRRNNWVKRIIHQQDQPTTIDGVRMQASVEKATADAMNIQPRFDSPMPPLTFTGAGSSRGRSGPIQGHDGWSVVAQQKQIRQSFEPSRMKITKTNVDDAGVCLGGRNMFSNWSSGSQGGGSKSQEQDFTLTRNRYAALSDAEPKFGVGRSPVRGDARELDRVENDRDYRRVDSRPSIEKSRNRGQMRPPASSSFSSSKTLASDRDGGRRDASATPTPQLDASKMSADDVERRLSTIADELFRNSKPEETLTCLSLLTSLDMTKTICCLMEKLIDKSGQCRHLLGQVFVRMVSSKLMEKDALVKGLCDFLLLGEDLQLDVPQFWANVSETVASVLVGTGAVLPITVLEQFIKLIEEQTSCVVSTFAVAVLMNMVRYSSEKHVKSLLSESGLRLSSYIPTRSTMPLTELPWLRPFLQSSVMSEVLTLFADPATDSRDVERCIEANVDQLDVSSNSFVRDFTKAVCRAHIDEAGHLKEDLLRMRVKVMRKYLTSVQHGLQALIAMQLLSAELSHPAGLAASWFNIFYEEELIAEESYLEWRSFDGPSEDMHGKRILENESNVRRFFDSLGSVHGRCS